MSETDIAAANLRYWLDDREQHDDPLPAGGRHDLRAVLNERDADAQAVSEFFASDKLGPAMAALHEYFADRINVLNVCTTDDGALRPVSGAIPSGAEVPG